MTSPNTKDQRLGFWSLCLAIFVAIESLDRATLSVWAAFSGSGFSGDLFLAAFTGLFEDLGTGVMLAFPFLAGLFLFAARFQRPWLRIGAHLLLAAMLALLTFNEAAEMFFWNEFDSRYNSIAVNYLLFPREVVGNIRQSFNLAIYLPLVGVFTALGYWALRRRLDAALMAPLPERRDIVRKVGGGALAALGGYALVVQDIPERYSNREVGEIAANSLHHLFEAAVTNDQRYHGLYLEMDPAKALAEVRAMVAQPGTRSLPGDRGLWRHVDGRGATRRLNVVLVIEESFGSVYVDNLGNRGPESTSPRLSALAEEGVFFTNIYATGNRTVRGLEATLTSFPPIPGVSTVRRDGSKGMNSLPLALKRQGYRTAFLYGGRKAFDNMGTFWEGIGFDEVLDQNDIADQGFTTVWGVSDEFLFKEALKRLDAAADGKVPVFLGLLTVSNHRPYTYPEGRIAKPPKQKRKENSATYADWAFGDFVEKARTRPWFKDTVFVFVGDHGPRVYGAATVPTPSYRVPLLYYSPGNLEPRRIDTLGSSMDLGPTLMGLLGFSYDDPFFGLDLTRVPPGEGRAVMEHNFAIAYARPGKVAILQPGKRARGYDLVDEGNRLAPTKGVDPPTLERAIALTQTAHDMFYAGEYHDLRGGMAE